MSGHEHVLLKLEMVTQSNNYQPQIGTNDKEWCFRWHIRCYKTLSQLTWFGQFVAFVFSHGNAKWADRGQSIMDVQINGLNPPQCWQCSLRRATTHPPYRDWMDQNRGRGGERKRKRRERVLWWSQCLPSNSSKYEDGEIMAHTAQDDWTSATMNSLLLRCILTEKRNKKERKKNWSRENLDSKGSLMPFGYFQPFFSILIY